MMTRRILHGAMALAFCVCIASLIDTTLSHSESCPLCGAPMERIGALHSLSSDRTKWRTTGVHRCQGCDYDVITPTESDAARPLPVAVAR